MMYLAAVEHRIRRGVTAATDVLNDVAYGFRTFWNPSYERSDYLDTAERLRQQLVEREAEEEVGIADVYAAACKISEGASKAESHSAAPSGEEEVADPYTPRSTMWNPATRKAVEDAYWCFAHNTTRMACKDKPHQSSAHAGADTVPAEPSPAGATSPAAGVTHPAPAVGLPPFDAAELVEVAAECIFGHDAWDYSGGLECRCGARFPVSLDGRRLWSRHVARPVVSALVAELAVLTVEANDQQVQR